MRSRQSLVFATLAASVLFLVNAAASPRAVTQDDLVKITFTASDMPHSFTIDGPYRISKRAGAGQSVTFEFRADQPGNHTIYCALSTDPKCKEMKATLTVR